jgi:hypothetical protein
MYVCLMMTGNGKLQFETRNLELRLVLTVLKNFVWTVLCIRLLQC